MPKTSLVKRVKAKLAVRAYNYLSSVLNWGGGGWSGAWWPGAILESFTGAWQTNTVAAPTSTLLSFSPVYHCVTGIASDVAKLRIKLSKNNDGIWEEITENQPWLPLLRNPNSYQNRIQFLESWMISKLLYGNAYILKERNDARKIVTAMYVLHPGSITPLVAEDGSVFYEVNRDDLSGLTQERIRNLGFEGRLVIPASEIIHDRMNTLWHPLVGVSPLYACGTSATMGTAIQANATNFFRNASRPSGVLTAPGSIANETAARLKAAFEAGFSGDNIGKTFVAGDGLTYQQLFIDAQSSQQSEQFEQARIDVATAFRYPLWKITGKMPPYTKPDQAQTAYYVDCLQDHIEDIELCLDNGLELPLGLGTELDTDGLMRMDQQALYESLKLAKDWMKLDEQRFKASYGPLPIGGDTVYKQEQDHSIEAIAKRDAAEEFQPSNSGPAATAKPASPPQEKTLPPTERSPEELSLMRDALAYRIRRVATT